MGGRGVIFPGSYRTFPESHRLLMIYCSKPPGKRWFLLLGLIPGLRGESVPMLFSTPTIENWVITPMCI
jgi:hypothetical protein